VYPLELLEVRVTYRIASPNAAQQQQQQELVEEAERASAVPQALRRGVAMSTRVEVD
jgi:hypothetical protein